MSTESSLKIHWMNASKASRILWLLYELDTPFAIEPHFRVKGRAPPELLDIHPLGKSPVVEENKNGKHKILAESGRITNYLTKNYDTKNLFSINEEEADLVDYYTQLEEATLAPNLVMVLLFNIVEARSPWFLRPLIRLVNTPLKKWFATAETIKVFDFLESELATVAERVGEGKEIYFVGDRFTQAEIMLFWPINTMVFQSKDWKEEFEPSKYPNLTRWADQIKKRPAYVKTQKKEEELNSSNKNSAF